MFGKLGLFSLTLLLVKHPEWRKTNRKEKDVSDGNKRLESYGLKEDDIPISEKINGQKRFPYDAWFSYK